MSAVVLVVGAGRLADIVSRELSPRYQVIRQTELPPAGAVPAAALALVLDDAWHPAVHQQGEQVFQQAGIPWLRGFVAWGEGVVGPLVRPGVQGRSQCADERRLLAGRDRKENWELEQWLMENGGAPYDIWASHSGLLQVAQLVAAETERVLKGKEALTEGHLYLIHLGSLASSRHFFLPVPQCPVCGQLPDDTAERARIALQPSPKISPDSYRCRSMGELKRTLVKDFLDFRAGMINGKTQDLATPFADVIVNLPLFIGDEGTAGRTHSFADSELTAILEGLERYCGIQPRGKKQTVQGSYRDLADKALNPLSVGVHFQEEYAQPDFPFQEFDPDRVIDWVWGYSFLHERPILVPELLAYYSLVGSPGYIYETSNGCALGGSLEEAIFYGIMEIVERDSFLMTWYTQWAAPRIDLKSVPDLELQLMVERLRAVSGYELYLYNTTLEHGIPSIWIMAKNQGRRQDLNLICAAGAHPDPVRAIKSAVHEIGGLMMQLDNILAANRGKYERMLHDALLVRHMDDHALLYGLPEAEERLHFLLDDNRPLRTFDEEFKPPVRHADLTDDLKAILATFRNLQLDVIVVDQTTPEMTRNGLHCVKVLIPGLLSMTFRHHLRRVVGLERVLNVPAKLGYAPAPLTLDQLNPHPHPFP